MKVGPGIGDLMPATMCAVGIVSAILRAHKTARVSSSTSPWSMRSCRCASASCTSTPIPRRAGPEGNHHPCSARSACSPAKDGHVTLAAPTDAHWPILCRLIGKPEMAATQGSPRCKAGAPTRPRSSRRCRTSRTGTQAELLKHLGGQVAVRAGPTTCATSSPTRTRRARYAGVGAPSGLDHETRIAGVAIKMSETPGRVRQSRALAGRAHRRVSDIHRLQHGGHRSLRADKIVA